MTVVATLDVITPLPTVVSTIRSSVIGSWDEFAKAIASSAAA